MSKGSKRNSAAKNDRLFAQMFKPAQTIVIKPTGLPMWLDMTDEQIDQHYFNFGKADRTRMKQQAVQERLRKEVSEKIKE